MNLYIKETWVNKTEHYTSGDSEIYETCFDNISDLYKSLRKEYGKCVSKMYFEDKQGKSKQIGWVFEKKAFYEDTKEQYIQETWVEVHKKPQKITRTNYFASF